MEKKQSSIDWLIGQIIFKTEFANLSNHYIFMSDKDVDGIIEQAKAMHKDEIIVAFYEGIEQESNEHGTMYLDKTEAEEYYNETFGGNNE